MTCNLINDNGLEKSKVTMWPAGEIWMDGYASNGNMIPILIPGLESCIQVM